MTMLDHIKSTAKAYTALLGSILTALLGVYGPETTVGQVLTVALAVVTAVATWAVPNTTAKAKKKAA